MTHTVPVLSASVVMAWKIRELLKSIKYQMVSEQRGVGRVRPELDYPAGTKVEVLALVSRRLDVNFENLVLVNRFNRNSRRFLLPNSSRNCNCN